MKAEPYNLHPDFERILLWMSASEPRFWTKVGHALDPECVEHRLGKLILTTIGQIIREGGRPPDNYIIIVQRLQRQVNEGKLRPEELKEVSNFFLQTEDELQMPDVEGVVAELVPVLKRRMQSQAVLLSHDEFAKRGDFQQVVDILGKAQRLGQQEQIGGVRMNSAGFDVIERLSVSDKLPTDVVELDLPLNQGLNRKCLGLVIADSGGGKSQWLCHQAANGVRRQLFTGFVTLELPEHVQFARVSASLTGIHTNMILDSQQARDEARRRISIMEPHIGILELAEFPPHATTVPDIVTWIDQREQHHQKKMELLVVDYGDKLHHPGLKQDNEYVAMRYVYEGMRRDIAVARNMWVWTASQASRGTKESGKRIDLHHVSDSMHKVRVADLILTLNSDDQSQQANIFVAKNRLGKARFGVGPLVTDYERGRFVPASREFMVW